MFYNIKQASGLKASTMHVWLGLACLVYLTTTSKAQIKAAKQTTNNQSAKQPIVLIALKTFLQTWCKFYN